MTRKITAVILSAICLIGVSAQAAQYTVTYYNADGNLINAKSINRPDDFDISEYINHYANGDTKTIRVHKFNNGKWEVYDTEAQEIPKNTAFTEKAPNVTDEMCHAKYWLNEDSDNLILSTAEIKELNDRIMAEDKTMMNDLDNLPQTYDGKAYAESLSSFETPEGIYLNQKPVDKSYYEKIRRNIRNARLGTNETVKYGICTTLTVLKAYPYEDWLSDSEWDKEWDNFVNTAVSVGEPLVLYNTTADGKFIYAISSCCEGWVSVGDVAVCKDKTEWENAKTHDNFLVITGEKIWLDASYDEDISQKQLTMGTVLELTDDVDFTKTNRLAWNNYAVKLPVRNTDGSYGEKTALISANRDVNIGYLPYTRANIIKQAFKSLGNRYGWGGMLDSQDCSSYVREVYSCFGLNLPRNTTWQAAMPVDSVNLVGLSDEYKKTVLDKLPEGTILFFPGHEMIYLGERNGLYYAINDVSSLVNPKNPDGGVIRPRSVIVNDLSTLRGNGTTWLRNISAAVIVR